MFIAIMGVCENAYIAKMESYENASLLRKKLNVTMTPSRFLHQIHTEDIRKKTANKMSVFFRPLFVCFIR